MSSSIDDVYNGFSVITNQEKILKTKLEAQNNEAIEMRELMYTLKHENIDMLCDKLTILKHNKYNPVLINIFEDKIDDYCQTNNIRKKGFVDIVVQNKNKVVTFVDDKIQKMDEVHDNLVDLLNDLTDENISDAENLLRSMLGRRTNKIPSDKLKK